MILKNCLKTLKCINRTTTLAKNHKKIYSIYNYIQKHNSKGKNIRQMHPHSFAASLLLILIFKNTSQIMRAKIPIEQKTMIGGLNLLLSPSFLLLLIPKHIAYSLTLGCYKWKGLLIEHLLQSKLPAILLLSAFGELV